MNNNILIAFLACLLSFNLSTCDGGNGNGEGEFTVFDVFINPDLSGCNLNATPSVPYNELKLSLLIRGRKISGTVELLAYGNKGTTEEIRGQTENDSMSLMPFEVSVASDPPPEGSMEPGPSSLSFSFNEFVGAFMDDDMDELVDGIEGSFSASLTIVEAEESTFCEEISGEITGIARRPEGCMSPKEAPTLECPAEGFINQCEQYDYHFCFGWCEPYNGGTICVDFAVIASECEVVDCLNVSCPLGPVNLEGLEDYGGFQIIVEDHIIKC